MQVIRTIQELQNWRQGISHEVGFVPTMGALHQGHQTLLERAHQENTTSVLSIFVNPTQFDDPSDLQKYPVTLESDLQMAQAAGIDCVWLPTYADLYPDSYRYKISENELSRSLCGAHRPGHFDGVLTVVMKLLNVVQPTKAYFGEKDFQQLQLVKDMVAAFFLPYQIIPCPTVREADGLAMSSRNRRLSVTARERAALFPQILKNSSSAENALTELALKGFDVDYVEDRSNRRFGAVRLEDVRLIDNVQI